jgi:hypothetical protein
MSTFFSFFAVSQCLLQDEGRDGRKGAQTMCNQLELSSLSQPFGESPRSFSISRIISLNEAVLSR